VRTTLFRTGQPLKCHHAAWLVVSRRRPEQHRIFRHLARSILTKNGKLLVPPPRLKLPPQPCSFSLSRTNATLNNTCGRRSRDLHNTPAEARRLPLHHIGPAPYHISVPLAQPRAVLREVICVARRGRKKNSNDQHLLEQGETVLSLSKGESARALAGPVDPRPHTGCGSMACRSRGACAVLRCWVALGSAPDTCVGGSQVCERVKAISQPLARPLKWLCEGILV
jgi:hypothetical protein